MPVVAFNYGARKPERMRKTIRYAITTAICIMAAGTLLFHAIPDRLLAIFDASEEMLRIGKPALRIISLSFPVAGLCIGCGSVFQALGFSIYSMITSMVRQLAVLVPCAYLIGRLTGNVTMVWWAFVVAEVFSLMLTMYFYRKVDRNVIRTL